MFRLIKVNSRCSHGSTFRRIAKGFLTLGCNKYSVTSNSAPDLVFQKLADRSLVRIAGKDASNFLQGLITNDMHHFEDNKKGSMYAMLLNQQGRVLYDVIIYAQHLKSGGMDYLIECDSTVLPEVCKHLKMYRVRKKLDIVPMEKELCVWSIFKRPELLRPDGITDLKELEAPLVDGLPSHQGGKMDEIIELRMNGDQVHAHTKDPRLASLGWRLVLSNGTVPNDIVNQNVEAAKEDSYRTLIYRLGIGEGVTDLPPANCLPLECNLDYLHGVSFHKGCYIGQELTARIHHTGVVRKRLLPMVFGENLTDEFHPDDSSIINEDGKNVGKFRGHRGNVGLGLLRIQECINSKTKLKLQLAQSSIDVTTFKPFWWPLESPKEIPVIKNP